MHGFLSFLLPILLTVHRFHKLGTRISGLILYFSNGFPSAVHDLQYEHGIVVDNIEEDCRVDEERQRYLNSY